MQAGQKRRERKVGLMKIQTNEYYIDKHPFASQSHRIHTVLSDSHGPMHVDLRSIQHCYHASRGSLFAIACDKLEHCVLVCRERLTELVNNMCTSYVLGTVELDHFKHDARLLAIQKHSVGFRRV